MMNTALVAGIFTVVGAGITLLYQGFSGHNANRRDDRWRCVDAAAELIAAAHKVLLALPNAGVPGQDGQATETGDRAALDDALYQFDSAYARLTLTVPALRGKLDQIREHITGAADTGARDKRDEEQIMALLDTFLDDAAQNIKFPLFKF
jgi:hypothetical protein